MLFERAIASADPDVVIGFEGERVPLRDGEREVTWEEVEGWTDWVSYGPPSREEFSQVFPRPPSPDGGPKDLAAALTAEVGGRETLGSLLAGFDVDWEAPEISRNVSVVSRRIGDRVVEVVSVRLTSFDEIAHKLSSEWNVHVLHQAGADGSRLIELSPESTEARVLDLIPLDSVGRDILLRIQPGGLIRTTDGGATWHDFNLGQGAVESALEVETVVVSNDPPVVYVLAYDYDDEAGRGDSRLFHLQRRDWIARWRAGLITLLGETPD